MIRRAGLAGGSAAMAPFAGAVAALLVLSGCLDPARAPVPGPPAGTVAASEATSSPPADDFEVRLSRSGCYGPCPSYTVTIHGDGRIDYVGRSHVFISGAQQGQAEATSLAALRTRLRAADFSPLANRYRHGSPACGLWTTDMPTVIVEVFSDGRRQRAEHDYGCAAAPAALTQIEQAIDAVAQSSQWTIGRSLE